MADKEPKDTKKKNEWPETIICASVFLIGTGIIAPVIEEVSRQQLREQGGDSRTIVR